MPLIQSFIDLSPARLVAQGYMNLVYEHDDFPGVLIKVFRPERISPEGQLVHKRKKRSLKFPRRLGAFHVLHREIGEILALHVKPANRGKTWPVARTYGFVETDIGFAVVVEKLTGPDGRIAPTVAALVKEKRFLPEHRERLKHFFEELERMHVCIYDIREENIVFTGHIAKDGRFAAVDGLGVRAFIPLRDWFRGLNTRRIRHGSRRVWDLVDASCPPGAK